MRHISLTVVLTPRGHLVLEHAEDAPQLDADLASRLESAFARGAGHGLLQLGAAEVQTPMPSSGYFSFDLCRMTNLLVTPQTWFIYTFSGEVMTAPVPTAFAKLPEETFDSVQSW